MKGCGLRTLATRLINVDVVIVDDGRRPPIDIFDGLSSVVILNSFGLLRIDTIGARTGLLILEVYRILL